jgi:hypothetical protein
MAETDVNEGSCLCGAVRYSVSGPLIWSAGCCCRDCARASGAPYIVWVGFSPDRVEFLSAPPAVYESSKGVLRGFCPKCGTSLTYGRDPAYEAVEPTLYVAASTFDNPEIYPPSEVVWYDSRPHWFSLSEGIPLHATVSPDNADRAYTQVLKKK